MLKVLKGLFGFELPPYITFPINVCWREQMAAGIVLSVKGTTNFLY
jgi:hypothetical protein